jgi:hypothetical protein
MNRQSVDFADYSQQSLQSDGFCRVRVRPGSIWNSQFADPLGTRKDPESGTLKCSQCEGNRYEVA